MTTAALTARTFAAFVRGTPAPKGSKNAFVKNGRAFVTEGKGSKQWQSDVARLLQDRWEGAPFEGAVEVTLTFMMLRPASVSAKKRPDMTVKPDIDKLARCILDAMTSICFRDDAQVTRLIVTKQYDEESGVHVLVKEVGS